MPSTLSPALELIRKTLAERSPCEPGLKHTFMAGELVCLCGALACSVAMDLPHVTLFHPADEPVLEAED